MAPPGPRSKSRPAAFILSPNTISPSSPLSPLVSSHNSFIDRIIHWESVARTAIQDPTFDPTLHFRLLAIESQIIGEIAELDSLLTEFAKEHNFPRSTVTPVARLYSNHGSDYGVGYDHAYKQWELNIVKEAPPFATLTPEERGQTGERTLRQLPSLGWRGEGHDDTGSMQTGAPTLGGRSPRRSTSSHSLAPTITSETPSFELHPLMRMPKRGAQASEDARMGRQEDWIKAGHPQHRLKGHVRAISSPLLSSPSFWLDTMGKDGQFSARVSVTRATSYHSRQVSEGATSLSTSLSPTSRLKKTSSLVSQFLDSHALILVEDTLLTLNLLDLPGFEEGAQASPQGEGGAES